MGLLSDFWLTVVFVVAQKLRWAVGIAIPVGRPVARGGHNCVQLTRRVCLGVFGTLGESFAGFVERWESCQLGFAYKIWAPSTCHARTIPFMRPADTDPPSASPPAKYENNNNDQAPFCPLAIYVEQYRQ